MNHYDGSEPFHLYLQKYFRLNKQFGSKDRKLYRNLCFAWWRIFPKKGKITTPESLANAALTSVADVKLVAELKAVFPLSHSNETHIPESIKQWLDPQVADSYGHWFQNQAPVFVIPFLGKENALENELKKKHILYEVHNQAYKIAPDADLSPLVESGICRIQDCASYNSIATLPRSIAPTLIWDCCSGAGGKSLALRQLYPSANLWSTDIRENILSNLKSRFSIAKIQPPNAVVFDLSNSKNQNPIQNCDLIIADVPCSGSGTWRRNPEQACFYSTENINSLVVLQRHIVSKALESLKPNGTLVYITCSVFSEENEKNVQWIQDNLSMQTISSGYCEGLDFGSDYIFRAVFKK